MTKSPPSSAALPIAHAVLRILIVLNWVSAAIMLALLFVLPNAEWIRSAFDLAPSPDADRVILGLRAIVVVGLTTIPLNYIVLTRLLAIVQTVREGDPFVATNASRLLTIARTLLTLQLLGLVIAVIVRAISTPAHPVNIGAGFSINGWLAVLLTYLLARVFAEGTRMRDDLEGVL